MRFVIALPKKKRQLLMSLFFAWIGVQGLFWYWWLQPEHAESYFRFLINSSVFVNSTISGFWFFLFALRARKLKAELDPKLRVAMIVTKAPSEPFEIAKNTLLAFKSQDYPYAYDVWLADEDPDSNTIQWAKENNVNISCRKGIPGYHNVEWPKRAKCKEGNLMYFYDTYGYENYDVVCQFDIDHIPNANYLRTVVKNFSNPKIGYVACPSLNDRGSENSWYGRGRMYAESCVQGFMQLGYNDGFCPICIGSHYAVRTQALKMAGGIGPELAEDYSTSAIINNAGWDGVFEIEAEAHGDSPANFMDGITQELQWSRSLMAIALKWRGVIMGKIPFNKKVNLLYSLLWYPLVSFTMFANVLIPIVAVAFDKSFAKIDFVFFIVLIFLIEAPTIIGISIFKNKGLLRPKNAKLFGLEATFYNIAKWPWIIMGISYSIVDLFSKTPFKFKVTPKGITEVPPISLVSLFPYLMIVLISNLVLIIFGENMLLIGYSYLVMLNIMIYTILEFYIIFKHFNEAHPKQLLTFPTLIAILSSVLLTMYTVYIIFN